MRGAYDETDGLVCIEKIDPGRNDIDELRDRDGASPGCLNP